MEPTGNVTVGSAASVEPVVTSTTSVVTIKLNVAYLAHCQGNRAKRLEALCDKIQQYTPEKTVEVYRSRILEVKSMMKTVFKEDKDMAQITHVHKIVDFLYYQCYNDQRPDQTRKRRGLKIKAKITANVWASMSKNEIAKIHVREQAAKKHQYDDLYGSDALSGTADLCDHEDYKYAMLHKRSKLK
jgi:hypothetical protein